MHGYSKKVGLGALNWSIATIINLLALLALIIVFIPVANHYRIRRHQHLLFLVLFILSISNSFLILSLAYLFLSLPLLHLALYANIPTFIFAVLFLDYIDRESLDPAKITPFSIMMTLVVSFSLNPDSVAIVTDSRGEQRVATVGTLG